MSLVFVVFGLIEFAILIVLNRTLFGTQEKSKFRKVKKIKMETSLKTGNHDQQLRILNHVRFLRHALDNKEAYQIDDPKHDEGNRNMGKVGKKCINSLHTVDIIAFFVFIFLFFTFNFIYFFYYGSRHCPSYYAM